jgi:hypothetical protein
MRHLTSALILRGSRIGFNRFYAPAAGVVVAAKAGAPGERVGGLADSRRGLGAEDWGLGLVSAPDAWTPIRPPPPNSALSTQHLALSTPSTQHPALFNTSAAGWGR